MSDAVAAGRFAAVLFDLDGTLVNSRPGIEASVIAALADVGVDDPRPLADALLGLPLAGLIEALAPTLGPEDRAVAVGAFARHYDSTGWLASVPYPGVHEVVADLRRSGVRLFTVTNKRRVPAVAILDRHGLAPSFDAIYTLDSTTPPFASKAAMARACMQEAGLDPWSTLVVGDSSEDRDMARATGAAFAAAAWGYGDAARAVSAAEHDAGDPPAPQRRECILADIIDLPTHAVSRRSVGAHP